MAPKKLVIRSTQDLDAPPHNHRVSWAHNEYDLYVVRRRRVWHPPTDVYETDEHVVVKVEVAGINEDELNISLADRRLIIAGHRRDPASKLNYQNMEIHYGEFRTEVRMEWALDESGIEATYQDGFLFVRLPKAKAHRVQVKVRKENDSV